MTTITAMRAPAPTMAGADGMARIAGLPTSVVPRASAQRLEIEFARKSLEQALKQTYVPAPAPGSFGRGLARFGPLALGLLASVFLTSGGERNLAVLLGKLPDYVSEADLQMASQAVAAAGGNAQMKPAGLDTSDKLGRFIVGAAALGRLHRDGKISQPMLAQALSRLQANVVAGRPASRGVFDSPARSAPAKNPTRPRDTGTPAQPNRVPQTADAPPRPVPRVSPLPDVTTNRTVPTVSPLPTVPGNARGTDKTRDSSPTRKPDLPAFPKGFDYSEAGLVKLLKNAGSRTLQQRVENYLGGRTTREQATHGLDGSAKTKMNAWLDAIDRSRMTSGGATGGRTVTSGARSDAAKSDFPMVRPVPTKVVVPPALDTSTWGLPMGEVGDTYFGKPRVPAKYLPQPNPSQSPQTTPTGQGRTKSFQELEARLLGLTPEDRSVAFVGNTFRTTARTPNEQFAIDLFKNQTNVASHFSKRTLADRPGQTPTSYSYGGHAAEGLFANITGKTYTEIATKVLLRVDELVQAGVLVKIGAGVSNGVYLHKPTQQVVRVGRISSNELQATAGFSKIGDRGVGAKVDLRKSLYLPNELISAAKTEGFAVLFMERVPGMRLEGNGYLLSSSAKSKVLSAAADALVTMHLNNTAHGDFGAHNVNVTANGEVRVIDFDLSGSINKPWKVSNDLEGMVSILLELYPNSRSSSFEKVRSLALDVYIEAVDRLPGPDRKAEVYKKHPELYEPHVARFDQKKDALKTNARAAYK